MTERIELVESIRGVEQAAWQKLESADFPFADYAFFAALEDTGCLGERTGWHPLIFVARSDSEIQGLYPVFLKTNSYGEYIFDWDWAWAYERNGLGYYPKLVSAIPFTPATGEKFLVAPSARAAAIRTALLEAAVAHYEQHEELTSFHGLFLVDEERAAYTDRRFLSRVTSQFHWQNADYQSFDDFLKAMSGKRRRQIQRERRQIAAEGLHIKWLTGSDLRAEHADLVYACYLATLDRKQGLAYLTRGFFEQIFLSMRDRIFLVVAMSGERPVACALNMMKGRHFFGRYWGALDQSYRHLHFELCYYQTLDYVIAQRMSRFEAGAQGEHKMQRGFLPTRIHSAHHIKHPIFRRGIAEYLAEERRSVAQFMASSAAHSPFRNDKEN